MIKNSLLSPPYRGLNLTQISKFVKIRLKIAPSSKKLKDGIQAVEFLVKEDIDKNTLSSTIFDEVILTVAGYFLEPGETLFCQTLEIIDILSPQHIGIVTGRTKISAYGISINLNQVKAPSGLLWNFPLHVSNNKNKTIIVYPFIRIAQLMVFPYAYGQHYRSDYAGRDDFLSHLGIAKDERSTVVSDMAEWTSLLNGNSTYPFQVEKERVITGIREKESGPWRRKQRHRILNPNLLYEGLIALLMASVPGAYLYSAFDIPIAVIVILGLAVCLLFVLSKMWKKITLVSKNCTLFDMPPAFIINLILPSLTM